MLRKVLQFLAVVGTTRVVDSKRNCNMYSNTLFMQLLKGLNPYLLKKSVDTYSGDKYSKGFRCKDQLIAMMYAQLSSANSLRKLETSFNSHQSHHYHLGVNKIKRSTLSDANNKRDWRIYADLCQALLSQAHGQARRELSDLLYLLDASPIRVSGIGSQWTKLSSQSRIPGLKLHVLYSPEMQTPCEAKLTHSKVSDIDYGRQLDLSKGAVYVFDKGYYDYNWWHKIDKAGSYFVTRFKDNAALRVLSKRPIVPVQGDGVISDEEVCFKNKHPGGSRRNHYEAPIRRITVKLANRAKPLVLATNDMETCAEQLAGYYKQRWAIELWFKWIKQNLKIKQFLGQSENAVRIQVYIALITYLLLKQLRHLSQTKQPIYLWLEEIKSSLFVRTNTQYQYYKNRRKCKLKPPEQASLFDCINYSGQ